MNLAKIREEYPEYNDMPDDELTARLNRKFNPEKVLFSSNLRPQDEEETVRRIGGHTTRGLPVSFQPFEGPRQAGLPEQAARKIMSLSPIKPKYPEQERTPIDPEEVLLEGALSFSGISKMPPSRMRTTLLNRENRIKAMQEKYKPEDYLVKPEERAPLEPLTPKESKPGMIDMSEWNPFTPEDLAKKAAKREEALTKIERTTLKPLKPKVETEKSLIGEIKATGGIWDPDWFGKDSVAEYNRRFPGLFSKKTGISFEELPERLRGFFRGKDPTPEELYEMLEKAKYGAKGEAQKVSPSDRVLESSTYYDELASEEARTKLEPLKKKKKDDLSDIPF